MLMRTKNEKVYTHPDCHFNIDDKPSKYEFESCGSKNSLRCPTADCDTKRTGPCKHTPNPKV